MEELSVENNLIQSFSGLENLEQLRKLNLSNNEIGDEAVVALNGMRSQWDQQIGSHLNRLVYLSIAKNRLTSLRFATKLPALVELYASFNRIGNQREIFNLKPLNGLVVLDLSSNPMCELQETPKKYRLFVVYHLRNLKSLDGLSIESVEIGEARDCFGGKLTADFVAERFGHQRLGDLRTLDFPASAIRVVELAATPQLVAEQFENLRSLNLENNALTSFSGIVYLKNLRLLCLNYNKIECIFPKSKSNTNTNNNNNNSNNSSILAAASSIDPILPNLEVLHLGYNGISDLVLLQVGRLTSLKALFLQGFLIGIA